MLASRVPGIMPPLTQVEAIDVANIHSLCGYERDQWQTPPFRHPHHTASAVALVGGGSHPKPGEISLAHNGILFLDELPEFQRHVLEVLREPLESGEIRISRAAAQLVFPANFQLIAAMNPCPCGYLSAPVANTKVEGLCRCSAEQIQRYRQKISGPLLDRIDLHIALAPLPVGDIIKADTSTQQNESSATIRQRVIKANEKQVARQGGKNASLSSRQIKRYCRLGEAENTMLQQALTKLGMSARAFHRVVKVARTIADLDDAELIQVKHIAEALSLRSFDRSL